MSKSTIAPLKKTYYIYSVKFVCGIQKDNNEPVVRTGLYSTDINIFNFNRSDVIIIKNILPLVIGGKVIGREPEFVSQKVADKMILPAESATMDDCTNISRFLNLNVPRPISIGFLEIICDHELDISVVYTVSDLEENNTNMHFNQIQGRKVIRTLKKEERNG
jgi:hypothetical protein